MNKALKTLVGAGLIGIVLITLSGCAYLNGDAMWLGKDQKSVNLSNTLLTITDIEYEFTDGNLPFEFNCKQSSTPYIFIIDLNTNSVFKTRICATNSDLGYEDDAVIAVSNGVATVHGGREIREWQTWNSPDFCWKNCGTSISQCKGITLIACPNQRRCLAYLSSVEDSYFIEIVNSHDKSWQPNCFVIEACSGAKLRHIGNWYDW